MNYASLFTRRKDGRYQTTYTDTDGKLCYLYDRDPKRLYERLENARKPQNLTFQSASEAWKIMFIEQANPRTWANYKPHLDSLISIYGDIPIAQITGQDVIRDLQRAKAQGYSRTIVNTRRTLFNDVLNYSVAQGWIPFNPCIGIKLPKGLPSSKRYAPTDDDIRTIMNSVGKPFGMFAFLLLCTGMRKGEALALLRSDICGGEISVTKSLTLLCGEMPKVKEPKSYSGIRTAPIVGILRPALDDYLAQLKGDILFPFRGGYMTSHGYNASWAKYCKATGLELTAHQLRHGTATLLYEAGVDVYTARKILGHAKVSTTMEIYTELRERHEKQSIEKLNTFLTQMSNSVSNV